MQDFRGAWGPLPDSGGRNTGKNEIQFKHDFRAGKSKRK